MNKILLSNSRLTKPTDTAFNWKPYRQPNALNKRYGKKEVVHLIQCWLRCPGSSSHMDIHVNVQLGRKKQNNPKPPDLLKHESHVHCDLIFKSYIKVNKNNNKIRHQLQKNYQFLAGKYQYFISTWLFQRYFKLDCVVVVDFYVQKKLTCS